MGIEREMLVEVIVKRRATHNRVTDSFDMHEAKLDAQLIPRDLLVRVSLSKELWRSPA